MLNIYLSVVFDSATIVLMIIYFVYIISNSHKVCVRCVYNKKQNTIVPTNTPTPKRTLRLEGKARP